MYKEILTKDLPFNSPVYVIKKKLLSERVERFV